MLRPLVPESGPTTYLTPYISNCLPSHRPNTVTGEHEGELRVELSELKSLGLAPPTSYELVTGGPWVNPGM